MTQGLNTGFLVANDARESMTPPDRILDLSLIVDEDFKIFPRFPSDRSSGLVPDGTYIALDESGEKKLEITYRLGVVHGPYVDYWRDGKVACEGQFAEGMQEGIWHFYRPDGGLLDVIQFREGKEVGNLEQGYSPEEKDGPKS